MPVEAAIILAILTFCTGIVTGWRWHGSLEPLVVYEPSPVTFTSTQANVPHVHEASHANPGGWFCDCGLHRHIYFKAVEGSENLRCQCGAVGIGKEWAVDKGR